MSLCLEALRGFLSLLICLINFHHLQYPRACNSPVWLHADVENYCPLFSICTQMDCSYFPSFPLFASSDHFSVCVVHRAEVNHANTFPGQFPSNLVSCRLAKATSPYVMLSCCSRVTKVLGWLLFVLSWVCQTLVCLGRLFSCPLFESARRLPPLIESCALSKSSTQFILCFVTLVQALPWKLLNFHETDLFLPVSHPHESMFSTC